jgi:hypothetical protein
MSRKELPRAGLVQAAPAGKITNRKGAVALYLIMRQFQRLKQRASHLRPDLRTGIWVSLRRGRKRSVRTTT